MTEVLWLNELEERAWRGLQRMQLHLTARLAHDLATGSNLSYQDYVVLVVLTEEGDGRMRLFELAQRLAWEKSRLSHHVTRMANRGLVGRERCKADRRGAYVTVTERGRRDLQAAAPAHVRAVRLLFIDRLSSAQLEAIASVAETVLVDGAA